MCIASRRVNYNDTASTNSQCESWAMGWASRGAEEVYSNKFEYEAGELTTNTFTTPYFENNSIIADPQSFNRFTIDRFNQNEIVTTLFKQSGSDRAAGVASAA